MSNKQYVKHELISKLTKMIKNSHRFRLRELYATDSYIRNLLKDNGIDSPEMYLALLEINDNEFMDEDDISRTLGIDFKQSRKLLNSLYKKDFITSVLYEDDTKLELTPVGYRAYRACFAGLGLTLDFIS